jgi:hypothetical protein
MSLVSQRQGSTTTIRRQCLGPCRQLHAPAQPHYAARTEAKVQVFAAAHQNADNDTLASGRNGQGVKTG